MSETPTPETTDEPDYWGDDFWDEPRPYCEHTIRTCSPDCPEWGGR